MIGVMIRTLGVTIAAGVAVAALASPVIAADASPDNIGITGATSWYPELHTAMDTMRLYGVPVVDGCNARSLCVTISHYRSSDGLAGNSLTGKRDADVLLNDTYDTGSSIRRVHVIVHELGHVAGLGHSAGCDSSMGTTIPTCGQYVVGFTPAESAQLRKRWAS